MHIQKAIETLVNRHDLSAAEMSHVMNEIMQGHATAAQIAAFLVGLRMKGETIDEIETAVNSLRAFAKAFPCPHLPIIDIVGSGGDKSNTFNISTTSAFVVAAAGGIVAKHGNRAISSQSGSADVLETAGIVIDLAPHQVATLLQEIGIGFLFAPLYHHAMRYASLPRKEIGIRTLFNVLGAMTNPANAKKHLLGVYSQHWLVPLAHVLKRLGSQHALIVHSADGLDEISINASTFIAELKNGKIETYTITPEQFNIARNTLETIQVKNANESYELMINVLENQQGPARDIVILNAGAAIYAGDLCESLQDGIGIATTVIEQGLAREKLEQLKNKSQGFIHGKK